MTTKNVCCIATVFGNPFSQCGTWYAETLDACPSCGFSNPSHAAKAAKLEEQNERNKVIPGKRR